MTAVDFLMDFAKMSVFMCFAQYLRTRVKLLQKILMPSSVVAGLICLLLGPQFLNVLHFSEAASDYPTVLIVVLFSSLFLGKQHKESFKDTMTHAGDTLLLNSAVYFGQYGLALLVGGAFMHMVFPNVNRGFALLMPGGFSGGHGTAATFAESLEQLTGWEEAMTVGQTFATIGILSGVLLGTFFINFATKKGATRFISHTSELPDSMLTGLVPEEEQESMGQATISSMSLEPLVWHLSLVLIATGGGFYLNELLHSAIPRLSLPTFSLGMLCALVLQLILDKLHLGQYVHHSVTNRIGNTATDYLVGFAVASIKVSVIVKYAVPLLVISLIGLAGVIVYLLVICPKLFRNFWFERGIFIFGWSTGVCAIGITLLRVVDPYSKSRTLEDYSMAYMFMSLMETALIASLPSIVVAGHQYAAGGICLAIFGVLLWVCSRLYGVFRGKYSDLRPGEAEILNNL